MYETFFRLSANPFQLNPDPALYFDSKGHRKAAAYLRYGAMQGEGFILMTGEIGAGKTTLIRALLRMVDPNEVIAAQLVSTQLDAEDLLRAVATAFDLKVGDTSKAALLGVIEGFLTTLSRQRRRALLVVDEAQNLTARAMEELRMLSNFQIGERPMLQSFLVGQPELRSMMRDPSMQQLRQRIIATCHLGPLEAEETQLYIEHRLRMVGWAGDPAIDAPVFAAVHESAGGIPRRINALCGRLLLGAYLSRVHEIRLEDAVAAINEMRDEGGPDTSPAPAARPAERSSDLARPMMASSVIARLDRLERTVNTILEIVRAQAPGDRRRFSDLPRKGRS